jgi:hypothetical protein
MGRPSRRISLIACCALWLLCKGRVIAQDQQGLPATESSLPAPSLASASDLPGVSGNASAGSGERSWSGPAKEGPKTFWERVPPVTSYPRPNNFFISPSGANYYTLYDVVRDRELPDRPKFPYLQWGQNSNPFFNADFRYLENPKNTETDWLDFLKRIHPNDDWLLSTGGEVRNRYATIQNAGLYNKVPQAGSTDNFDLFRARIYGDVWYLDMFRIYAEFITAQASPQSIPPSISDVDKADLLNLFGEIKLFTLENNGVYVRGGRQELLYGSQRVISPSDWSNSLRTFQGVKLYWHDDKIEFDAFWMQPVIVDPGKFDSVDDKVTFAGNYWKYRFNKDTSLDLYYLYLASDSPVASGKGGLKGSYDVHSLGSRFVGQQDRLLWDFEGVLQFGDWSNQRSFADMSATGVGWWFKDLPAGPTLWAYFDHASGDPHPGSGIHETYNQIFPFGHLSFGSFDAIGRQNIDDVHAEMGLFPTAWMRITTGYHYLTLDSSRDALYSTSGSVVRQDKTGRAGTDVGNAITSAIQFHVDDHQMVNVSYAHLFAGPFIKKTAVDPRAARDLDGIWLTYSYKW